MTSRAEIVQHRKFFYEESEIAGTFFLEQRVRARVCSLCEVINFAETLNGHLDFFIWALSAGWHTPLTTGWHKWISLALQQSCDVLVCPRSTPLKKIIPQFYCELSFECEKKSSYRVEL
jgi:hypothetical protein